MCNIEGMEYYPVVLDGRKKIIQNLPISEDPGNYEIHVATCEVEAQLHTRYVAVKNNSQVAADKSSWEGQGRKRCL